MWNIPENKSISYLELLPSAVKASHFWEPEGGSYQTSVSSICATEDILSMNDFIRHSSLLPPKYKNHKILFDSSLCVLSNRTGSKFLRARKNDPRSTQLNVSFQIAVRDKNCFNIHDTNYQCISRYIKV